MAYAARIVLDSLAPSGGRLTTFELTFPRIILAEFNTHRMLSRNSASSRAIPVKKMIEMVEKDPFIPETWGRNQPGMQSGNQVEDADIAESIWRESARESIWPAKALANHGVHKQIVNRILEPYMWHTVIVSGTEWSNFFSLRDNDQAQPEMHKIAGMMHEIYNKSSPMEVGAGMWHLPLVDTIDILKLTDEGYKEDAMVKISAARCARVSYLTHNGVRDPQADLELYHKLVSSGHMSPLEHPAQAMSSGAWREKSRWDGVEWKNHSIPTGNFWGWMQHRKQIENEHDYSKVVK